MKKILKMIIIICIVVNLSGCLKKDNYENITIYTTVYPIEYISKYLYEEYSEISSIYPVGTNINEYVISSKKLNNYSKGDLFIYNGLSNEKSIAASLLNKNKKMDIIDVSQGLEINSDVTELWLSPSNFLMMMTNIKNNLKEYITNNSILSDIDLKYEDLKLKISEIDAELNLIADNAVNKKIIVANNSFKFLEKYGFEVISISSEDEKSNTNISKAQKYFSSKENTYLFTLSSTEETDTIKDLKDKGATILSISNMLTLTEEEAKNKLDYLDFLKSFVDLIKKEVY